ncbi:MAG: hypothetical protein VKJ04_11865 [Vampirovibrionales bacterium]|nr:hypothetical protein [Vampirovibrionales bacterium]
MVTSLTPSGLPKSGLPQNGLPKMSAQAANRRLPFSSASSSSPIQTQPTSQAAAQKPVAQTAASTASSQSAATSASNGNGLSAFANVNANASVHRTTPVRPAQPTQPFQSASTFSAPQDTPKFRTGTERALQQLETRYQAMFEGIQLKYFDPNKIENYIRMAEKRMGMELSEKERIRLIQISKSKDPNILKLLALELRIGIPKRLEQAALAALGELLLQRDDEEALQAYLEDPTKDDNLKAYVRTVMMMNKVERVMARVENAKSTLKSFFNISGQGGGQQQQKKKKQQEQKKQKVR